MSTKTPSSPPNKNAVSSSELLSMLKKAPSKEEQVAPQTQQTQQQQQPLVDDRGMLGLLQLIKSTAAAVNLAAVGVDLEALGLALDSSEPVTRDWDSPWSLSSSVPVSTVTPSAATSAPPSALRVPTCYLLPPSITLNPGAKLPSFADETLLYIFYAHPMDRLQELSARELTTARAWRYHKDLQLWMTVHEGELPVTQRVPSSRLFTVVFDTATWTRSKRDVLVDKEDVIEDRFLKR